MNQREIVLDYLKKSKKGITSMEAFKKFGITRLSSVIYDLRNNDNNIVSVQESDYNRNGTLTHYVRYFLLNAKIKDESRLSFWSLLNKIKGE